MKKLLPILCFLLFSLSCKKINYTFPAKAETLLDISYGADPLQKLDLYLPAQRTSITKVIVLLHGGAFIAGDKKDFSAHAQTLADKGFAVLNVNYRLVSSDGLLNLPPVHMASTIKISEQLADVKAAIDLVASQYREYQVSETKWAIAGHSAGGTLSLLYAYGDKNSDGRIKAAANWAGVTDLSFQDQAEFNLYDPRLKELYFRMVGAEPLNANKLAFMAVSPIWLVLQRGGIPTLNIRPEFNVVLGLPDASGPQYTAFTAALNSKSVANQYNEIKGADHGFNGNWTPVLDETALYFESKIN